VPATAAAQAGSGGALLKLYGKLSQRKLRVVPRLAFDIGALVSQPVVVIAQRFFDAALYGALDDPVNEVDTEADACQGQDLDQGNSSREIVQREPLSHGE
jgi:hypothetical protein